MTHELTGPDLLDEDAAAVRAVLAGDLNRYHELVQRHERRIFALAWSRLGNVAMAEEATQEAFITAYRRLILLSDPAKFASWLGVIARNISSNLALRHWRELRRRERWALDQTADVSSSEQDSPAAETLREALEALPARDRECLVIFYLERKSGADTARLLGISESALRVRLHRARGLLRERLEHLLERSLEQLTPTRSVVSVVMAAVLASSSSKAAAVGGGAAAAGALTKVLPLGWLLPYITWLALAPMPLFAWIYAHFESRNFRDPKGFRARLLRKGIARRLLWLLPLCVTILWLTRRWDGAFDPRDLYFMLGCFSLATAFVLLRSCRVISNRYLLASTASAFVVGLGMLAIGSRWLPLSGMWLVLAPQMLIMARVFGDRPVRHDYNLFLRAQQGMLPESSSPFAEQPAGRDDLVRFAKFLGARWLLTNYQWNEKSLQLWLTPVRGWRWGVFERFGRSLRSSNLELRFDGGVQVKVSDRDWRAIQALGSTPAREELEARVKSAVASAWACFREGDLARARLEIGESEEEALFRIPPRRTRLTRWYKRITIGSALFFLAFSGLLYLRPPWFEGLRAVQPTEQQVRASLAQLDSANTNLLQSGLTYFLTFGVILPPADLLAPASLDALRSETLRMAGFNPDADVVARCESVGRSGLVAKPLDAGWLTLKDLGVSTQQFTGFLRERYDNKGQFILPRFQSRTDEGEFTVERFDSMSLARLRFYSRFQPLQPMDRARLISHVSSLQVLTRNSIPGLPRFKEWRDVRGFFAIPGWPLLQTTYFQLAALELLGGLDRIDREACISAILKLHRGKGYFVPPDTTRPWVFRVEGDAEDTFAAFESLRILGALDRVKDIPAWEIRLHRREISASDAAVLRWQEIEAFLVAKHIAEHVR